MKFYDHTLQMGLVIVVVRSFLLSSLQLFQWQKMLKTISTLMFYDFIKVNIL